MNRTSEQNFGREIVKEELCCQFIIASQTARTIKIEHNKKAKCLATSVVALRVGLVRFFFS